MAHIKVGETYHQRKEVSDVIQRRVFLEEVAVVQSQACPQAPGKDTASYSHFDFSLALYLHRV